MPSRFARAVEVTEESLSLAWVPVAATLLSGSEVARALAADGGGGITFPFPAGLPTLWTYVSLPSEPGGVGGLGGPLSLVAFVPLFVVGLLATSALEAGFLGALDSRIDGGPLAFTESVRQFTVRIVGVNVIRFAVVLTAVPFIALPPLAMLVVLVLTYLVYGLPFAVVVGDHDLSTALGSTLKYAKAGNGYAAFGVMHVAAGAVGSVVLSGAVRNLGAFGILFGTAIVAVPAVVVGAYGLLLFRELDPDADLSDLPPRNEGPRTNDAGAPSMTDFVRSPPESGTDADEHVEDSDRGGSDRDGD